MMIMRDIVGIITLIITVAIVAVILSPNAKTTDVFKAFSSGLSELLKTVVSPVTGAK